MNAIAILLIAAGASLIVYVAGIQTTVATYPAASITNNYTTNNNVTNAAPPSGGVK